MWRLSELEKKSEQRSWRGKEEEEEAGSWLPAGVGGWRAICDPPVPRPGKGARVWPLLPDEGWRWR
jgi:hypothetical protein